MTACVYVATAERGVKVGYARDHVLRFRQIAHEIGQPVALAFITGPLEGAAKVEALAHWKLRDHHIGGEWFSCDAGAAWEAVNRAIEGVARGETPERRVGNATPFADLKDVRVTVELPPFMVEAVDEWRRWQPGIPSRSAAIRRLIADAISTDERKSPKPDTREGE